MYQVKILSGLGALTPYTGTTTTKSISKVYYPTAGTSIFKVPLPTPIYQKPSTQSPPIYVPPMINDDGPGSQPPTSTTVVVPPPPAPVNPAPTTNTPTPGTPVDTVTGQVMPQAGTTATITPGADAAAVYEEYAAAAGAYPDLPWRKIGMLAGALGAFALGFSLARR